MKVLITGSNGLLGQKLVALLHKNTAVELIATAKGANRLPLKEGYTYLELDITNAQQVADVVSQTQPDAIIHTAAMTNVDQCEFEKELCWKMNVEAVQYLVKACESNNSFLIHLSTDFIFDGKDGPYTESDVPSPLSFYGWSKLAAEHILLQSSIRWAIARTVLVYGIVADMSRSNIILWVKKSLEEKRTINVVTDQFRTPTLAEDLAMGCWLIAQQKVEGVFNISGKDFLTPYEMAMQTADFFDLDSSLISKANSSTFAQPAQRPPRTGFVLNKAKTVLGYQPHSFKEGVALLATQVANSN